MNNNASYNQVCKDFKFCMLRTVCGYPHCWTLSGRWGYKWLQHFQTEESIIDHALKKYQTT